MRWVLAGLVALGLIFGLNGNVFGLLSGCTLLGLICFFNPKIALTLLIFSVSAGEFGRISLGNFGFLITDLLALFTLAGTLPFALKTKPRSHIIWLTIFVTIAILSLLLNFATLETNTLIKAWMYLARFVVYGGLLFTLPVFLRKTETHNYFFKCLIFSAVVTAILGFLQLHFFPDFEKLELDEVGWDPHKGRLTSTWLDPNFVGGYFAFIATVLISQILKNPKNRLFYGAMAFILFLALYFTFSRSAYLALAVGLTAIALLQARWLIAVGLAGIVIILGSGTRASERIWDMANSFTALFGSETSVIDPTSRLRLENWGEGFMIVKENPWLGTGYGTYGEVQWEKGNLSSQEAHSASGADSSLLTVWATTGTLGLIFYLGFLVSLTRFVWKNHSPLAWGILAGMAGIFVHGFFVNSLFFTLILSAIVPTLALIDRK